MRVGALALGTLSDWEPTSGAAVSWQPAPTARDTAMRAPVSTVPVSYMQEQHLRGYRDQQANGLGYSRLMILSGDMPGRCDLRAMNYVVNAHLRRHDTYHSWFEFDADDRLLRHTIADPADIEFVPVDHGELTADELRKLLADTPEPLQWDCFRYGIIQAKNHFTFFASIDHVHVDAAVVGVTLMEFHLMYGALVAGGAPLELPDAGSYNDFCIRQQQFTAALTAESPQVAEWRRFAESNDGSLPDFPLPLGDPATPCETAMITATMLGAQQTAEFEAVCTAAGARFIGGVLACAGLAHHELTGADTYYGLTPSDTRRVPQDTMTQGWFTGLVPVTVGVNGGRFDSAARAAQRSFDTGMKLAEVPYQRAVELSPTLRAPRPNFPVINFLDAAAAPLSVLLTADLENLNIGVFTDGEYSYQLSIFVIRVEDETAVTVMFPDNPTAHASMTQYLAVLKSVFERVVGSGRWENVA